MDYRSYDELLEKEGVPNARAPLGTAFLLVAYGDGVVPSNQKGRSVVDKRHLKILSIDSRELARSSRTTASAVFEITGGELAFVGVFERKPDRDSLSGFVNGHSAVMLSLNRNPDVQVSSPHSCTGLEKDRLRNLDQSRPTISDVDLPNRSRRRGEHPSGARPVLPRQCVVAQTIFPRRKRAEIRFLCLRLFPDETHFFPRRRLQQQGTFLELREDKAHPFRVLCRGSTDRVRGLDLSRFQISNQSLTGFGGSPASRRAVNLIQPGAVGFKTKIRCLMAPHAVGAEGSPRPVGR